MLEYWNNGIMGFGVMGDGLMAKLSIKNLNKRITSLLEINIPSFHYSISKGTFESPQKSLILI
jgi:hypothetical protein